MIEIFGDLFDPPGGAFAICVTTNTMVNKDGRAIMGKGTALVARNRWPGVDAVLGERIKQRPEGVHCLTDAGLNPNVFALNIPGPPWRNYVLPYHLIAFPTKRDWRKKSDLDLIRSAAAQLYAGFKGLGTIVLPRPGCANGGLDWAEVKRVLAPILVGDQWRIIDRG